MSPCGISGAGDALVDPEDVRTFQLARALIAERERRRVSDAEVFRLAVSALVASLDDNTRAQLAKV